MLFQRTFVLRCEDTFTTENGDLPQNYHKAEMRKMYFEHGSELGIENGLHIGAKDSGSNKTKTQKLYHKVKKDD